MDDSTDAHDPSPHLRRARGTITTPTPSGTEGRPHLIKADKVVVDVRGFAAAHADAVRDSIAALDPAQRARITILD